MFGQAYKKVIIVMVVFNLSACSVVGGLWYERIDQFIANQFLESANFSPKKTISGKPHRNSSTGT